jgi:D-alanine-D-alanine ligase
MTLPSTSTLTVAVLAGGRSSEHEVSLSSAKSVREGLRAGGHEVEWVEIGEDGIWRHGGRVLGLKPGEGLLDADVVFPALHGPFGEDGTVQGLLETLGVAYVGAGVSASAVCMDKVLFKLLMRAAGDVPQTDFVGVREEQWEEHAPALEAQIAALGLPVFVKPAHLGSSVGIAKVSEGSRLADALEAAFAHDELAIVEAMAAGVEVECGVLGNAQAAASEPGEIMLAGGDSGWYDFEAKYAPGGMRLLVPARISDAAREHVRELALRVFAHAGCEGLARVDFFVDGERVLVNELNTMPGFTPTSVYAKLWESSGVPYAELVDRLCRLALERHDRSRAHRH